MDVAALIGQMREYDSGRRRAAADALVAAGPPAIGPLVAALLADRGFARGYVDALRRFGDAAFRPLLDALVEHPTPRAYDGSPSSNYAVGIAFAGLPVTDRAMFVAVLDHDDSTVRSWACAALTDPSDVPRLLARLDDGHPDVRYSACHAVGRHTDGSSAHLPALLALLSDPVDVVRRAAVRVLRGIGPEVVPTLRELRRTPGRHRRHALAGLAETVGWNGLDATDRALVRRLIRVKAPREVPEPFEPNGQWYAIPTDDRAAVLHAFDLSDPMPVTMRLGQAAVSRTHTHLGTFAYVTPVMDGWTLVFVAGDGFADRAADLSRRFGTAHAYYDRNDHHGTGYVTGWCVAEGGTVVRCHIDQDGDQDGGPEIGAPLPVERDGCGALEIAARISVDPAGIGPHTRVDGQPLLALTANGRRTGVAPAALPV